MIVAPLLLAPTLMAAAAFVERRLGPSAAGWVAALPFSFAVAVLAVALDAGTRSASAMALSAASHVPAQVLFAAAFAHTLTRRGLVAGATCGALAYVGGSVVIAGLPHVLAAASALPLLALVPRVMPQGRPRRGSARRRWFGTALTCAAAPIIVGGAVMTTRLAGPDVGGAVVAFPIMCAMLAVAVATRDGRHAGAHSLAGLVRSLPCYLAFCLAVALTAPAIGLAALALGVLACIAAAAITWRGVAVAQRPAMAP